MSGTDVFTLVDTVRYSKFHSILHISVKAYSGARRSSLLSYGLHASQKFITASGIRPSRKRGNVTVSDVTVSIHAEPLYSNVIWSGTFQIKFLRCVIQD